MALESILSFLIELKENNNRDWFQENKSKYQKAWNKLKEFTDLVISEVSKIDKNIAGITSKDCMFRIYRDVRFSKNKEPYKTNLGSYITKGGRKGNYAGLYLHFEPDNSFIAGGSYCPESKNLLEIRSDIFYNPQKIKSIINTDDFKKYFGEIWGEKLKTSPKGFPKDFEDIELLRYKSYNLIHKVENELIKKPDYIDYVINIYKKMLPFNNYLNSLIE